MSKKILKRLSWALAFSILFSIPSLAQDNCKKNFQVTLSGINRTLRQGPWKLVIRGKEIALYRADHNSPDPKDYSSIRPDVVTRLKKSFLKWEHKLARRRGFWKRHIIDDSSKGADGVRLGDADGDGLLDITTGWEEGNVVRVYLNPGTGKVRKQWPAVTVGQVNRPEDAVFADLDADGAMDVVSCCEGWTQTVFVHWAPENHSRILEPDAWHTRAFDATAKKQMWMFALPMQIDGKAGIDLVIGSKQKNAQIGWLQSPVNADPRNVKKWKYHFLCDIGWTMSLVPEDVDGDGNTDVVVSDNNRHGRRGVFWLRNPGPDAAVAAHSWKKQYILAWKKPANFLTVTDLDRDSKSDILCTGPPPHLIWLRRHKDTRNKHKPVSPGWKMNRIRLPAERGSKAVRVGDINLDGKPDIVVNVSGGADKNSVYWMNYCNDVTDYKWAAHKISGPLGQKWDLIELLDLDGDGDLDVITCEEDYNLGVCWYENPAR